MLEVEKLTVCYGKRNVVDELRFSVRRGEWLMIVGPNGAGKSTVINAISGGAPYSGRIRIEGDDASSLKPAEAARRMGVLAQTHSAGYGFTVEEVVRLGRYAYTRNVFSDVDPDGGQKVEEALSLTGLTALRHQSVLTLSGGELQRTFLAQLFAQDPHLLLLDEPANHLDLVYQKQVFELIGRWLERPGRAVVSVVHDLSTAKAYGTHALLMHQGRRIAFGRTDEVLTSQNLEHVYEMDVSLWMEKMLSQWTKGDPSPR